MHVFTSITTNYLPKARVLATTLKRHHPDAVFHLVLSDTWPTEIDFSNEPFDRLWRVEDLPIPNREAWIFKHAVVEMCTAVKGIAAREIAREYQPKYLYYLDPDIAVLGKLDGLNAALDTNSVVLTPHLTTPETEFAAIEDNEICAMRHGIYNLGFVGVNPTGEGLAFLDWWSHRLLNYCYDDIPMGLFTDQRWVDHAPAFFPNLKIIREPQYNVATWNMNTRLVTGEVPYGLFVNGNPLGFFHFSGFDSGAQEVMLKMYGGASPVLFPLRDWYIAECEKFGQSTYGKKPCIYSTYDDGIPIPKSHRLLYRNRADLRNHFPNPFNTSHPGESLRHWIEANPEALPGAPKPVAGPDTHQQKLETRIAELELEIAEIRGSRAWKLAQSFSKVWRGVRPAKRA